MAAFGKSIASSIRGCAPYGDEIMSIIKAPWSDEQVTSLNAYQNCNECHPFTGTRKPNGDETPLIATPAGWIEEENGPVVQDWAHSWMLNWEWRTMTKPIEKSINAGAVLDGKLFATIEPPMDMVLMQMQDDPDLYLPLFSNSESLEKFLTKIKLRWTNIKQIHNGVEFINWLPRFQESREIKIILDPYYTPENTVHYIGIERVPTLNKVEKSN
jgi:hypothetical protein